MNTPELASPDRASDTDDIIEITDDMILEMTDSADAAKPFPSAPPLPGRGRRGRSSRGRRKGN